MSGLMTRITFWSMPSNPARSPRRLWGAWCVAQMTRPRVVGSGAATHARGSMAMLQSRWLTIRCLTTRRALRKAASGSPFLIVFSCSMFLGASACSCGAPGFSASKTSVTAGKGSHSTCTAPTPSWAA